MAVLIDFSEPTASNRVFNQAASSDEEIRSGYKGFSRTNFLIDTAYSAKYTQVGFQASNFLSANSRRMASEQTLALFIRNHPYRKCFSTLMKISALRVASCAAVKARGRCVVPFPSGGASA